MKIAEIPFAVLRFQYQIARLPLQLIENQMAARLGSEAPARLFYERSLGAIDATVGNLLGDPELEKRGAALVERSDALGRAAQLDATATQNREQADAKLEATRDDVVTDVKEARDATEQEAVDARITAEERKGAAEEAAEKRTAAAKRQADDVAAQRRNAVNAAKRQEQAKIRAAERKATQTADSKLDDAQAKRSEAARKRAQADRVEELADAREAEAQIRAGEQQLTAMIGESGPARVSLTSPEASATTPYGGAVDVYARHNVKLGGAEHGPTILLAHGFGCDQNLWRLVR